MPALLDMTCQESEPLTGHRSSVYGCLDRLFVFWTMCLLLIFLSVLRRAFLLVYTRTADPGQGTLVHSQLRSLSHCGLILT